MLHFIGLCSQVQLQASNNDIKIFTPLLYCNVLPKEILLVLVGPATPCMSSRISTSEGEGKFSVKRKKKLTVRARYYWLGACSNRRPLQMRSRFF